VAGIVEDLTTAVMTTIVPPASTREPSSTARPTERCCARREALYLSLVLAAGLILRLALLWRFDGMDPKVWDEGDYDQLAVNLVQYGEFGFEPGQPTSLRPPLYPAMVAGIYQVAGVRNYQAVRLVQIALGLATAVVVYLIGRSAYGARVGLIAAAICCFYPSLVGAANLVLTETLFTLLVCLFVLAMQRYLSSGNRLWLVNAGVTLGLAALTRSVLWLFPPLAFVYLLFLGRERTWLSRLASAATLVLACGVTLAPWTIRNTLLQKTFTTVDVMGGRNVMMGNYEYTLEDRPWATIELQDQRAWYRVLAQKQSLKGKTQGQIDKLAMRYAIDYVLAHPGQTIERSIAKFFHFWQLERELIAGAQRGLWGEFSTPAVLGMAAVILGAYMATMAAGIFGAWMRPTEMRLHVLLLLLIAFVTGLHALAFGHSRYHLPLMPLAMLYAAAAIYQWRNIAGNWRSFRFAGAAACLLVLAVSWGLEIRHEISRFGSDESVPVTKTDPSESQA
jgi:4-amino-4-deoxy-L-arabinose transferase-like glycosyltransferase